MALSLITAGCSGLVGNGELTWTPAKQGGSVPPIVSDTGNGVPRRVVAGGGYMTGAGIRAVVTAGQLGGQASGGASPKIILKNVVIQW